MEVGMQPFREGRANYLWKYREEKHQRISKRKKKKQKRSIGVHHQLIENSEQKIGK
jgi:hypothetical protein